MLAAQLGVPISYISEQKGADLLAIKKKLGLPDARFDTLKKEERQLSDLEAPGSIALSPSSCDGNTGNSSKPLEVDKEMLVKLVTEAVMKAIGSR